MHSVNAGLIVGQLENIIFSKEKVKWYGCQAKSKLQLYEM